MDHLCLNTSHKLVMASANLTGEEVWACSGCGYRGKKANIPHGECLVQLHGAQQALAFVHGKTLHDEHIHLAPWLKWIHQVDFDSLHHTDANELSCAGSAEQRPTDGINSETA